jgi:putative nucleotidyltransferase with HDIG domain
MASLRSVDAAIAASLDLRIASTVILGQMTGTLGLDAAAIHTFHPESQTLRLVADRGFLGSSIFGGELRIKSLAGEALLRRRPGLYPRLTPEQVAQDRRGALHAEEKVVGYFVCPLTAKGRPLGVLEGFHRSPLTIDGDWRDFFETLAEQTAIAIDNATLFERLQRSNAEITLAYDTMIEGWARALDMRDKQNEGHSLRVADLTLRLARQLGLSDAELVQARRGALLHDIGKLAIPDAILHKPEKLSDEEWAIMRRYPQARPRFAGVHASPPPGARHPLLSHREVGRQRLSTRRGEGFRWRRASSPSSTSSTPCAQAGPIAPAGRSSARSAHRGRIGRRVRPARGGASSPGRRQPTGDERPSGAPRRKRRGCDRCWRTRPRSGAPRSTPSPRPSSSWISRATCGS